MRGGERSEAWGGRLRSEERTEHPAAWCHARRPELPCPCLRRLTFLSGASIALELPNHRQPPQKNRNRSAVEMDAQTPHQIKASKAEAGVGTPSKQIAEGARVPAHAHSRRSGSRAPDRHGPRELQATARPGLAGLRLRLTALPAAGAADARPPTQRRERLEACTMWRGTRR